MAVSWRIADGLVRLESDETSNLDEWKAAVDEFVQLAKTTRQEGTGLGLPISKRLAEALGGSLTVTSQPAAGSTFRLELPQHADRITSPRLRRDAVQPQTTVAASN